MDQIKSEFLKEIRELIKLKRVRLVELESIGGIPPEHRLIEESLLSDEELEKAKKMMISILNEENRRFQPTETKV